MEKVYEEAFVEVNEVLKLMPIDLLSKIPAQFRQTISDNKATNYKVVIKEPLEEQKLKKETVAILGLIYRDFLASPEEKEKLQMEDAEELDKIEQEIQKQYNIDNIFEKKKKIKDVDNQQFSTDITIYKESNFLSKLFNIIKGIFKKNKF